MKAKGMNERMGRMNGGGRQREVEGEEARASPSALRVSRLGDKKRSRVGAPLPALPLPPRPPLPAACSPAEPAPATARCGAQHPQEPGLRRREAKSPLQGPGISNRGRPGPRANRCGAWETPRPRVGVPNNSWQEPESGGGE